MASLSSDPSESAIVRRGLIPHVTPARQYGWTRWNPRGRIESTSQAEWGFDSRHRLHSSGGEAASRTQAPQTSAASRSEYYRQRRYTWPSLLLNPSTAIERERGRGIIDVQSFSAVTVL